MTNSGQVRKRVFHVFGAAGTRFIFNLRFETVRNPFLRPPYEKSHVKASDLGVSNRLNRKLKIFSLPPRTPSLRSFCVGA